MKFMRSLDEFSKKNLHKYLRRRFRVVEIQVSGGFMDYGLRREN